MRKLPCYIQNKGWRPDVIFRSVVNPGFFSISKTSSSLFSRFITGTTPIECPAKTYSSPRSGKCVECPAGFKCSRPALSAPEDCGQGFYNNATGQLVCTKCEAGRECLNSRKSVPCKAGYYSKEGETNCVACSAGNYSESAASFCLPCPAGNECINPSVPPVNCSEGYISKAGGGKCTICEPG